MNEEPTLPPHQPNTFRTWLPRIWRYVCGAIGAYPDRALILFLIAFGIAVIL